jgi:hypothetical protein
MALRRRALPRNNPIFDDFQETAALRRMLDGAKEVVMNKLSSSVFIVTLLLTAAPGLTQQAAPPKMGVTGTVPPSAILPSIRHLVYRFGYNTKAADAGNGTGTTTIDIAGMAKDGNMIVKATDNWWNSVNPRQTSTCEVAPDGAVNCAEPPYAISPIQVAIVPMLGKNYFAGLSGGPHASWQQTYSVKATFAPIGGRGFVGQVYTWNCSYALQGKGTSPSNGHEVNVVQSTGSMTQQGGRYVKVNQKAGLIFDPKLQTPVYASESLTFVPRLTVNQYTVELKLINYSKNPQ